MEEWAILTCRELVGDTKEAMDSVWLHSFCGNGTMAECLGGAAMDDSGGKGGGKKGKGKGGGGANGKQLN